MEILNWKLLAHPLNWIVLFLMVFIAGFALHLIFGQSANVPLPTAGSPLPPTS